MTLPKDCPGFEQFKNLSSVECACPECGREIEIFSDEFEKPQVCPGCKKPIDFSKCQLGGTTMK